MSATAASAALTGRATPPPLPAEERAGVRGSPTLAAAWLRARATSLLHGLVAVWIFAGGMVITEPSPYELAFLLVLGVSTFAGFTLRRSTLGLLVLFASFIPFAIIAAFQVKFSTPSDALIYQTVTIFLFFTAYWVANFVAEAPGPRMRLIIGAYLATALLSAILGTLGYLGIGHDLFTRYDRAKAFFNDPNVFGPFLILPGMYVLQRILIGTRLRALWSALAYGVLMAGVFASFSRAAWGHMAISSAIVYLLLFALETHARQKVRMLVVALVGLLLLVLAGASILSIPEFRAFIELRTESQTYDTGETGRFGRQGYAFDLALQNPLGLGPLEFRNLRVKEEPHDTYVNVLHAYGWGGGLALIAFIAITIWRGVAFLFRPSPNRLLLIPLVAVFVPLAGEAAIIDVDHWRHFFLVGGLIWGVTAGYQVRDKRIAPSPP
ncbi:MAG: O-antigen ligase family protein [Devosia sp.]|uniref:O-antigen ligase family protein n=1 Tax=Devosia sp. TaxID=1871048 RepID=UPI0026159BF5|nr:O-antigen ligase family protein [Devosia sp.]MDB5541691.1 O-antigen ligase family protein [Devosia sp.]